MNEAMTSTVTALRWRCGFVGPSPELQLWSAYALKRLSNNKLMYMLKMRRFTDISRSCSKQKYDCRH